MKYIIFFKKNITKIFIALSILVLLFCVYNTSFGYIEHLGDGTDTDCSSIKEQSGIKYVKDETCIASDPNCVVGRKCRICKESDENNENSESSGNCAKDGIDSYSTGKHLQCCPGTKEFQKQWVSGDQYRFKCCIPASNSSI